MTSNLGSQIMREEKDEKVKKEQIDRLLMQTFRPEFINRLDAVVMYKPLSEKDMDAIVDLQIDQVKTRLQEQNIAFDISPKAKTYLAIKGYDPVFGARPLKRLIDDEVLDEIALQILEDKIKPNDKVIVTLNKKNEIEIAVTYLS
jgi:ATP-dependent Clp protease ATP-binding subunit ClpB